MKKVRKLLALMISTFMILSLVPTIGQAADPAYKTFVENKTFTFDQGYDISEIYVGNANNSSVANTVSVAVDPKDGTNYALKISQANTTDSAPYVMPFFNDSASITDALSLEFDFLVTDVNCALSINPRSHYVQDGQTKNTGYQSASFKGGYVKNASNGVRYGTGTYSANKWYHVTYIIDVANKYVGITIQDKDARVISGAQIRNHPGMTYGFYDFCRYSIGHQDKVVGDIYIDNLTQKTIPDFQLPTDNMNSQKFYNTLSDNVWNFDGNNLSSYITEGSANANKPLSDANTNTITLEKADGKSCMVFDQNYASSSIQAITYMSDPVNTLETAFTIKKTGKDEGNFGLNIRAGDTTSSLIRMTGKKLYLLWAEIGAYELDTWYDIDLKLDLNKKYAHLKWKKSTDATWVEVDMPYGSLYAPNSNTALANLSQLQRIVFQWFGNTANGGKVYITNFKQNTLQSELTPTLNSHNDTFDSFEVRTSSIKKDSYGGWYAQNFTNASTQASIVNVDGENMLKLESAANGYPTIMKEPFYSGANVLHRIRVRLSGPTSGDINNIAIRLNDPSKDYANDTYNNGTSNVNYNPYVVQIKPTQLVVGDTTYNVALSKDEMYDVEFVYDALNKIAKASVITPQGVQYVGTLNKGITNYIGTEKAWGALSRVAIQNQTLGSSDALGGVLYVDDFKWDILPSSAQNGNITFESSNTDDVALDEWVTLTFGETLDSSNLNDVIVNVTNNGVKEDVNYTLAASGEKLIVKFDTLLNNGNYSLNVSNVPTLLGRKASSASSAQFKTSDGALTISKPVIDAENKIVTVVESNYNHHDGAMMIIALLDANQNITKIINRPLPLNRTADESHYALDLSGYDYTYVKAIVIDNLTSLYPYCEHLDTTLN